MQDRLYPIYLKLADRTVLVVGGGPVAARRTARLVESGAVVTVVSPEAVAAIHDLEKLGKLRWIRRKFQVGDVDGAFLVFVATGDERLVNEVRALADDQGFLLNTAEDQARADFHVPATVELPPVSFAISTSGVSPVVAAKIRDALCDWATDRREEFDAVLAESHSDAKNTPRTQQGWVYLVGAGPGDPELLTVRARKLLDAADVVYHDRLVSDEILSSIGKRAEKVYVGKEVGQANRANISELMIRSAREGRTVVRLKGGDPLIYGRAGEEMLALRQASVGFEVVPGVSALNGVPAALHIPVTFRGVANELVVRSGHRLQPGHSPTGTPTAGHETTYVYFMSVSRLQQITDELLAEGLSASTPAAIIQSGTLREQRIVTTELRTLASSAIENQIQAPALTVVGNVVLFRELERFLPLVQRLRDSEVTGAC